MNEQVRPKLPPGYRYASVGLSVYIEVAKGKSYVRLPGHRFRSYQSAALGAWRHAYEQKERELKECRKSL